MATQAIITLDRLRCIRESDRAGTSHSDPYIWPALGIVTNNSFEMTPKFALLSDSRSLIKSEMRAGDVAAIPYPGNTLKADFDDTHTRRELLLIVALWEQDSTPSGAVQAGYQAYLDELHVAVGQNLLALDAADPAGQDVIIDGIKTRVYDKVYAAERGRLSTTEATRVFLGWLNLDDFMGTDYKHFPDLVPTTFTLKVSGAAGDLIVGNPFGGNPSAINPPIEYEIEGNLAVVEVTVDPCQAQMDAVAAAEAAVDALKRAVRALQRRSQNAPPQQKAGIIAEIEQLNDVHSAAAKERLEQARAALKRCRIQAATQPTTDRSIVIR